ncbi:uncharacterized protein B0P05DRAFT_555296 [Gilbertella persicaria]|uniref:uncharacterized protein n=1 Tax=Gilbertella persicaria TaxID=101096 RepID=UPI0022207FFC|nr:uncharacterized protein B0P05DRAFT_555296 [Gilbertella persicaria]KAI8063690.1 hypothetical protein B0P05DRAFT_555296 [Gilbertella persicaria]
MEAEDPFFNTQQQVHSFETRPHYDWNPFQKLSQLLILECNLFSGPGMSDNQRKQLIERYPAIQGTLEKNIALKAINPNFRLSAANNTDYIMAQDEFHNLINNQFSTAKALQAAQKFNKKFFSGNRVETQSLVWRSQLQPSQTASVQHKPNYSNYNNHNSTKSTAPQKSFNKQQYSNSRSHNKNNNNNQ